MSDQHGFTLVELLVAMALGIVVLLAAFTVLDTAGRQQVKVASRAEAVQRGRQAMETMTQQLRSMVCLSSSIPSRAVVDGTPDQVTFYADLGDGSRPPQMRRLTFDPASRRIVEQSFDGTSAIPPAFPGFPNTPSRTRVLIDGAARLSGRPVFAYHVYSAPGIVNPAALATPLATADAARVVDLKVSFLAVPTSGPADVGTGFSSDVLVRFANPATPTAPMPCV
jgi:prepilin-type N-terminal cleavage/methylation domain-containing protein